MIQIIVILRFGFMLSACSFDNSDNVSSGGGDINNIDGVLATVSDQGDFTSVQGDSNVDTNNDEDLVTAAIPIDDLEGGTVEINPNSEINDCIAQGISLETCQDIIEGNLPPQNEN